VFKKVEEEATDFIGNSRGKTSRNFKVEEAERLS